MTPLITKRLHRVRSQMIIGFSLLLLVSIVPTVLWGNGTKTGSITIQLSGVVSTDGKILAALYREDSYLSAEKMVESASSRPSSGNATLVFTEIPFDTYAIALFHDKNGNQKLDKSAIGIPKEPYGFSNNAKPTIKAPSFKQTAFRHNNDNTVLSISL